jgi:hypothetical protein
MAFFADRIAGLDRVAMRERVLERFSAARMTDRYEELYARSIGHRQTAAGRITVPTPTASEPLNRGRRIDEDDPVDDDRAVRLTEVPTGLRA